MASEPEAAEQQATASHNDEANGVDVSLIRWMLSLSVVERLAVLQGFADSAAELMNARRRT